MPAGGAAYPCAVATTKRARPAELPRSGPVASGQPAGSGPVRQDRPTALDPPMVPIAVAGIAAWAVAGLVLLPFQDRLAAAGHGSWLWICLAGFLSGFPGLAVMIRHDANRRRRRTAGQLPADPSTPPGPTPPE